MRPIRADTDPGALSTAGEAAPPKTGSLKQRLIAAGVIVPIVVSAVILGGWYFAAVVITVIVLSLWEFYGIIQNKGLEPNKTLGIAGAVVLALIAFLGGSEYFVTIVLTAVLLLLMILQLTKRDIAQAISSLSATFFGIFYVGWLMSHVILLRNINEILIEKHPSSGLPLALDPHFGIFCVLFPIVVVALGDTGAYFCGRKWGKIQLAPRISPKKTIEGAVGGVLVGTVGGLVTWFIFYLILDPEMPKLWHTALLGMGLAVLGVLGDLIESLIKRDAKMKDSSSLLLDSGGMLDRIDSTMIALPVMYYYLIAYYSFRLPLRLPF